MLQDHLLQDADAGAPRRNRGGGRRHRPPFPSSLCGGPIPEFSRASYEEEEADPMFMAEVTAQKASDGYETMDVDFVPASESPMVQAD